MQSSKRKRLFGLLLVFFVCMVSLSPPFQSFASLPSGTSLIQRTGEATPTNNAGQRPSNGKDTDIVKVNGNAKHSFQVNLKEPISLQSDHSGQTEMKLKLFGAIPIKTVKVNVVPDLKVIPGGQTIGVKIKSAGILVVGHHLVTVAKTKKFHLVKKRKFK